MFIKNWRKEIFTIPNLLSLFRLFMIPIYTGIYVNATNKYGYYVAGGILAVSCVTDLIDGLIAREFNMVSNLGKVLDPLADKATQLSLLLCLTMKYKILWYLLSLFILKESFQLIAGGINLFKHQKMLKGAQFTGKLCTTVLFITLILMVMFPDMQEVYIFTLFLLDVIFLLMAFADYLITYCSRGSKFQSISDAPDLP